MFFPLCHVHQQPLKPGVFYEWSRFNPLVRRSYLLKDTMVIDDGRESVLKWQLTWIFMNWLNVLFLIYRQ